MNSPLPIQGRHFKSCKVCHQAYDSEMWDALPLEGTGIHNVSLSAEARPDYMRLELRTCHCGNSLSLRLMLEAEPVPRTFRCGDTALGRRGHRRCVRAPMHEGPNGYHRDEEGSRW